MIRRLKTVGSILNFFRKNENESYFVSKLIIKLQESNNIDEICEELNRMAAAGDAQFERGRERCEYRIDLENNNIDDENITFRLMKRVDQIEWEFLCKIVENLSNQQKSIEDRVDKLVEVEKRVEGIAQVAEEIENNKNGIEAIVDGFSKKCEDFEKANKEAGNEIIKEAENRIVQTAEETVKKAEEAVNKMIEEALTSRGRIGSSLQDMQKEVIQYMAIFIAVFSLINLNIGGGEKRSLTDFLGINLLVVSSMVTLFALLSVVLRRPEAEKEKGKNIVSRRLCTIAILLWIVTAAVFILIQCGA